LEEKAHHRRATSNNTAILGLFPVFGFLFAFINADLFFSLNTFSLNSYFTFERRI